MTKFVNFFGWFLSHHALKLWLFWTNFLTNFVILHKISTSEKWQNLPLFSKKLRSTDFLKKNSKVAAGFEPALPGYWTWLNLSYPNLYLTKRALINYTTETSTRKKFEKVFLSFCIVFNLIWKSGKFCQKFVANSHVWNNFCQLLWVLLFPKY